jgi:hypothetical protein
MLSQKPYARLVRDELEALRRLGKTRRLRSLQLYLDRMLNNWSPVEQPTERPKVIAAE